MSFTTIHPSTVTSHLSNKPSDYFTRFDSPIIGNYKVGLKQISFQNTWININSQNNFFNVGYSEGITAKMMNSTESPTMSPYGYVILSRGKRVSLEKYEIPVGHYKDINSICDAINNSITKPMKRNKAYKGIISAHYDPILNRVRFEVPEHYVLTFADSELNKVLGIQDEFIMLGITYGQLPPFLYGEPQFIHVTVPGLIAPSRVCDEYSVKVSQPVLATIPILNSGDTVISCYYNNPHYFRVINNYINTVRICLSDENFKPLSFASGEVITTLEFIPV